MRINQNTFDNCFFINLKNEEWLEKQRVAGKIAAKTLVMLERMVKEKTTLSLLELNKIAENFIISSGGKPTFKNYKGFPAGVCISVNKELAHGIPKEYYLKEGDIVSFDLGVTFEGAIADSAITCIYGEPKSENYIKLIQTNYESLIKGIDAIKIGSQIGVIGEAIYRHVKKNYFGVVTNYGGHGLDWDNPHSSPFIPSRSESNKGVRIQKGLSIAIEPMIVMGNDVSTRVLDDGWTIITNEIGSHFEHSIFVHEDHVEILTSRENL